MLAYQLADLLPVDGKVLIAVHGAHATAAVAFEIGRDRGVGDDDFASPPVKSPAIAAHHLRAQSKLRFRGGRFPALPQVCGFAEAKGRTAVHSKLVQPGLIYHYEPVGRSNLEGVIRRADIHGPWTLIVIDGFLDVVLDPGGWVLDMEAVKIGLRILR